MPAPDEVEAQYQRLRADLERQLARTARFLRKAMRDGRLDGDVEAARRVGDELADLLEKNFGVVSRGYERASAAVAQASIESIDVPEAFTAQSVASLRAQVSGTLDDIATIGREASEALRTLVVDVVRSQVPPEGALAELAAAIDGTAARVATLLDTGLAGFDRAVTAQVADEAGVEWYLYDGPTDDLTREFCAERVGKRFTLAMLDATDNDTGPNPPSIYCGGWNCRHYLVPLLDEADLALYPVG